MKEAREFMTVVVLIILCATLMHINGLIQAYTSQVQASASTARNSRTGTGSTTSVESTPVTVKQ